MRLIQYTPEQFELVRRAGEQARALSLCHRPFVDYYYASGEWCKLYLAMADEQTVGATVGVDVMPFEYESRPLTLGFGTNFHSLQPGSGGVLFMQWIKSCDAGMVFGGTGDTHRILEQQKWTYFEGIKTYFLNPRYRPEAQDAFSRRAAKWAARNFSPKIDIRQRAPQVVREAGAAVSAHEEDAYSEDLLPRNSPFTFRFAPPIEYLAWRYNLRLSFARYRLFRLRRSGETVGYVIINDGPDRLIVSQCDADDPAALASGILLSLAEAAREDRPPREILLTSSHPAMQAVYEKAGFQNRPRWNRPFTLGLARKKIEMSPDTSNWLMNYDWGDNGLRTPFLDQTA